jgi:predicted deacylase
MVAEYVLTEKDGIHAAELPVKVIRGAKQGPVFTIVAGIHGYEYPPIVALQELMSEIEPGQLNGTLVIVPVANVAGFYGRSVFYNPEDGKNLNRVFPGKADGTISERLADLITKEIITGSDVFLDIHAGDGNEDLVDFVCYYDNKNTPRQTALAKKLANESGFGLKVMYPFTLKPNAPAEYAFKQATQQGVTALSFEAGKLGNVQKESVDLIKSGIMNLLRSMNMYPAQEKLKPVKTDWLTGQIYIKSPEKGIFYSDLKSGVKVRKGQSLGYITDLFGKKVAHIAAPGSGIILYKIGTPPVHRNETLFCIGYEE